MKNFKIVSILGLLSISLLGSKVLANETNINDIHEINQKIESLTQERLVTLETRSELVKERDLFSKYTSFTQIVADTEESPELAFDTFKSSEKELTVFEKLEQTDLLISQLSNELDVSRERVSTLQDLETQLLSSTKDLEYSSSISLGDLKQKESEIANRLETISNVDIELSDTQLLDQTKKELSDKLAQVSNDIKHYKTLGEKVVANAKQYLGVPYVWGGKTAGGMDCSGLTLLAYSSIGKDIGTWTVPQESSGSTISVSQAQVGDLLFWGSHGSTHHVGIYIGGGQFIHAPTEGDVVKITNISDFTPDFAVKVI